MHVLRTAYPRDVAFRRYAANDGSAPSTGRARRRRLLASAGLALLALLMLPVAAAAATAPTLELPAASANFVEGRSIEFQWKGTLQGDADAIDRSFFRVELVKAADMPSGVQSEWPSTVIENFVNSTETTAQMGVPSPGAYKWRVCAWGVADDVAANQLEQLAGGCSSARAFDSAAPALTSGTVGQIDIENKVTVPGKVETVRVPRSVATPTPDPVVPDPIVEPEPRIVEEVYVPSQYQKLKEPANLPTDGSSVTLPARSALRAETAAQREGLTSAVARRLTAPLPLLPIPFWTLALMFACLPLAKIWRRDVLAMFDWADGSVDGSGGLDEVLSDLSIAQDDQSFKDASDSADGVATSMATSRSDGGRLAA